MRVYIGTYTHGASQGIYLGEFDPDTGRLEVVEPATYIPNPSFLAVDHHGHCLYAVSETSDFDGQPGGSVHAFARCPGTGNLTLLNSRSSGGADPCHLCVDPAGRFVLVSNYGGGSLALLPINADGGLAEAADIAVHQGAGPHLTRQDRPHVHAVIMDPVNQYALVTDLGLDQIFLYQIDAERIIPHQPPWADAPAGSGPRQLVFHPEGHCLYVINELDSTLTAWRYDSARGQLREMQTLSTLPEGYTGTSTAADVQVHPSGRFLYGSNRGHDSLAVFAVEAGTGRLTPRGHLPAGGQNPRSFAIDPAGNYLLCAHQDSDTVATFAIDPDSGTLSPTGYTARVPSPVCVLIPREH